MGSWFIHHCYCSRCDQYHLSKTKEFPCPSTGETIVSEWSRPNVLPNIFCDTAIAKTLRWLVLHPGKHTYGGREWDGALHRDFMAVYKKATISRQTDSSHLVRYRGWLFSRDQPYGNSLFRVMYLGPKIDEWIAQLSQKERMDAFGWAERCMSTNEKEAEFWLPLLRI